MFCSFRRASGGAFKFTVEVNGMPYRRSTLPEYYEIKIKGHLDQRWSEGFTSMNLTHLEGDETLLSGLLPDQAALHGLLERIRDLNIPLISLTCSGKVLPQ